MPAKAPLDENVKFLYACLLRSDYKSVSSSFTASFTPQISLGVSWKKKKQLAKLIFVKHRSTSPA